MAKMSLEEALEIAKWKELSDDTQWLLRLANDADQAHDVRIRLQPTENVRLPIENIPTKTYDR